MTTAQLIICLAIAVYLIAMLGVGVWFAKRTTLWMTFIWAGGSWGPLSPP